MSFIEGNEPAVEEQQQESDPYEGLSDYGRRFVESQPEEKRADAMNYVRDWDAGYTKAKSQWEQEINRYRSLGQDEELSAGVQLYRMLRDNPQRIADYLAERGISPAQAKAIQQAAEDQEAPDPYADRFQSIESQMQQLLRFQQERIQREENERAKSEFLAGLEAAEKTYGKYDRDTVLAMIASGQFNSIDDAVQRYHQLEQQILREKGRGTAPSLLGSGNNPPVGGKKPDFGAMDGKEVSSYLTSILEQAKNG